MTSFLKAAALGLGLWAASLGSQAQAADATRVVKSITISDVAGMISDLGLSGFQKNNSGSGMVGEYKGTPVGIFLDQCQGANCSGLVIEAAYGKQNLSEKFLLAFNKHYLPRLIAHEDGKIFLWMPVQFGAGVSMAYLQYNIELALDASEKAKTYQLD